MFAGARHESAGRADPAEAKKQEHSEDPPTDVRPPPLGDPESLVHAQGRGDQERPDRDHRRVQRQMLAWRGQSRATVASGVVVAAPNCACQVDAAPQRAIAASSTRSTGSSRLPVRRHAGRLGRPSRRFSSRLPEDEGKAAYEQLIQSLGSPPAMQGNPQMQNANAADAADANADEYGDAVRREHDRAAQPAAVHDGEERLLEPGHPRAGAGGPPRPGR